MSMTPMNRKEVFLKAVADGSASPLEPMTREELWLDAIIKAIAEGGSGGGSSGGGDVVVSHITRDTVDGETVYTCDMTVAEIQAAQNNGKTVFGMCDGVLSVWYDVRTVNSRLMTSIVFVMVDQNVDILKRMQFMYANDGSSDALTVAYDSTYTLTPAT